ncbi:putative ribonuclease H-like domain-containing protein, partial [Tanacetum coccineum]
MIPRVVLLRTGQKLLNTVKPVYTAHPKPTVHCARPKTHFYKPAQSTVQRPFYKKPALINRNFNHQVNTVRPRVNTARSYRTLVNTVRPRVNTARPFSRPVNTVRENGVNAVKPSACWVWRPTIPNSASLVFNKYNYIDARGRSKSVMAWVPKGIQFPYFYVQGYPHMYDKGFVDSGCSRHMTGNIAYLSNFKEFDGGNVRFGGGAYGGRIFGKGTLKINSIDFDDVYFVKELKFNLFSVSQMCDKKNYVLFTDTECLVLSPNFKLLDENQMLLRIPKEDNMYSFNMRNIVPKESLTCLATKATLDESILWHKRLGKQHRASCKSKLINPITKPLFMLHIDLFGPTFMSSLMHKKYCLVITNDYSRFTWVFFLVTKDETSGILKNFIKEIENLVDKKVKIIRCDNGTEFKNSIMDEFCKEKGIKREYNIAKTPQQNGVAKRKNRTLIEAVRTMLADSKLPTTFWAEAVSTACYVQNRVLIVKPHNKTPYELFRGFKPALSFMKPFRCHVTILNTLDHLGKFDGKSDESFFVGYSLNSKAFRVYNTKTRRVEENLHVRFLENKPMIEGNGPEYTRRFKCSNSDLKSVSHDQEHGDDGPNDKNDDQDNSNLNTAESPNNIAASKDKSRASPACEATYLEYFNDEDEPKVNLGNITSSYTVPTTPYTRININHPLLNVIGDFQSSVQTRRMKEPAPEQGFLRKRPIGTKWIFRNKKDERGIVIRNKARLVAQGYTQEEGIDYDDVFAPVARIKAIRLFLAYASFMGIMVYQMDVKSAFLYGQIEEEDKYIDDILKKFNYNDVKSSSTPIDLEKPLVKDGDANDVDVHLYRSMIGSLMYLTASRPDIMFAVCACARFQVNPKTLHLTAIKRIFKYLKGKPKLGLWYSRDSPFELVAYTDSDYAGATEDKKSTTR